MKRFKTYLSEQHYVSISEHPDSGDLIYAHPKVKTSTVTIHSRYPAGPPGTLLDDHEYGDRHRERLNNLGEFDPKA